MGETETTKGGDFVTFVKTSFLLSYSTLIQIVDDVVTNQIVI